MTSYPTPEFTRPALAPAVIAAITLVAGVALVGSDGFIWIRFAVSILALIIAVFAVQAARYWWLVLLAPIVIAWNPVLPIPFEGTVWQLAQFAAAFAFITVGVLLRVVNPENRNRRGAGEIRR